MSKLLYLESYTAEDLEQARQLFRQCSSVEYMLDAIKKYSAEAVDALTVLPDSDGKKLLQLLTEYLINREK